MQAIGRQTDNNVADFDQLAGDDLPFLHHAQDEAGQVVLALRIKTRHLGGFAADQSAAIVLAGLGNAFDYLFRDFWLESARGQVIHEK